MGTKTIEVLPVEMHHWNSGPPPVAAPYGQPVQSLEDPEKMCYLCYVGLNLCQYKRVVECCITRKYSGETLLNFGGYSRHLNKLVVLEFAEANEKIHLHIQSHFMQAL